MMKVGVVDLTEQSQQTASDLSPYCPIELDWYAYWLRFRQLHGDNPLEYGDGRLLLPDGWQYADDGERGQEYPPPADERRHQRLQLWYWRRRLQIDEDESATVGRLRNSFESLQAAHSAPLQQVLPGGEGRAASDLDLSALDGRTSWLQYDIGLCRAVISELERRGLPLTLTQIDELRGTVS